MKHRMMVACLAGWLAVTAVAQDARVLKEAAEAFERCSAPGFVLDEEQSAKITAQLDVWRLRPDKLTDDQAVPVMGLPVYAALALGDAATARAAWDKLSAQVPEHVGVQRLGYLVACATGNAQLAETQLKLYTKQASGTERRALSRLRRCVRGMGVAAPEVSIRTKAIGTVDPSSPGDGGLLLHFWNLREAEKVADEDILGLQALCERVGNLTMVGINADAEADEDAARDFARDHKYEWPHRYEGVNRDAPVTHKAFKVGRPPWLVAIDSYGYVRAIGDAGDPGLSYALLAIAAEAEGTFERVLPTARDGSQPRTLADVQAPARPRQRDAEVGGDRDDPEAEAKLRQARVYLRTGSREKAKQLFREIVSQYPGTIQARKAAEYLQGMP